MFMNIFSSLKHFSIAMAENSTNISTDDSCVAKWNIKLMDTTKQYHINTLDCELHPTGNKYFLYHLQTPNPTMTAVKLTRRWTLRLCQQVAALRGPQTYS